MITAAVVCPPAPFLVPGLAPTLARSRPEVSASVARAMGRLVGLDRLLVLAAAVGDGVPTVFHPGDVVTAAGFGRHDHPLVAAVRLAGSPGADATPSVPKPAGPCPGAAVGAVLVDRNAGGIATTVLQWAAGDGSDPTTFARAAAGRLCDGERRAGLLVMADGAACHGDGAPGGEDVRAASFDDDLVAALLSGDGSAVTEFCRSHDDLARQLRAETLPALAMFGALAPAEPARHTTVEHYSAPFGIGYPIVTWTWDDRQ